MILSSTSRTALITKSIVASVLLGTSVFMIRAHLATFAMMSEAGPIATEEIPSLERRKDILLRQTEVAQLTSALRSGTDIERIRAYALPAEPGVQRFTAAFELMMAALQQQGDAYRSFTVEAGERALFSLATPEGDRSLSRQFVRIRATMSEQSLHDVLAIFSAAGTLTLGDLLSDAQRTTILELSEQENPALLPVVEQFLATDSLQYAQDPRSTDAALQRNFGDGALAQALRDILSDGSAGDTLRALRSDLGAVLHVEQFWPLPFTDITGVSYRSVDVGEMVDASIDVMVFGRGN